MSVPAWFRIYERMPILCQNVATSIAGLQMRRTRFNRSFWRAFDFLEQSQWRPLSEQQEYQNEQLRQTVQHAYNSVPYYREVFDARRLKPSDVRTVDDLPKLPILDKQTIRQRFDDLQSRNWPARRRMAGQTGGTTGTALKLACDIDTQRWQWAVWWRHRARFGLKVHEPYIAIAGRSVVPLSQMNPPFWRRNWPLHQTYVSIHHLLKQNMPALVEYLNTRTVAYYTGYPSGLYLLADYLLKQGIRLQHPPRVVSTGAETLLPHQRQSIARALEATVIDQYGQSEKCANISECERQTLHVDMEFGAIEFLPLDGQPAGVARMICTSLRNPVMPLIRYDIGDVATLTQTPCACGRAAPTVAHIDGRIESYIVTPDGRQMGRLDFLFKKSESIEEAQLIQDSHDHLTVKLVRAPRYSQADEAALLKDMREYLGKQIRIDFDYVSEIPREPNGKFRQIVSHILKDRPTALSDNSPRAQAGEAA